MMEFLDIVAQKRRFLIAGILIVGDLLLLSLLASTVQAHHVSNSHTHNGASDFTSENSYDSPNLVANSLSLLMDNTAQAVRLASEHLSDGIVAAATGMSRSTATIKHGVQASTVGTLHGIGKGFAFTLRGVGSSVTFVSHGVYSAFGFTARDLGGGVAFVGNVVGGCTSSIGHVIGGTLGLASHLTHVSSVIHPANSTRVPVITPSPFSASLTSAVLAPPAANTTKTSGMAMWPIHGAITTWFGVPELPYEAIHTGLDISDGAAPGVTPIRAFKAGRVLQAIQGSLGLGNHVILDHGKGMTSVYGHMNSISVKVGQYVAAGTVLGYEGETGVATGVHLHFEIRINGQAVNPLRYISGRP